MGLGGFARVFVWCVVAASAASGCESNPRLLGLGEQCDLDSDCDSPLICRLTRCRRQCISSRDCGAGLRCFQAEDGVGVCQLVEEKRCTLNTDCPEPLVCSMGECTNVCSNDEDCPAGAQCRELEDGFRCFEEAPVRCVYDSNCQPGKVCGRNQICRVECGPTDELFNLCRGAEVCIMLPTSEGTHYYCDIASAGTPVVLDAGPLDAGSSPTDAGVDAGADGG